MDPARPPARLVVALALLSASALMLQVATTRILSATSWYHFAFLVVSLALLGYGLSGSLLAARAGRMSVPPERLFRRYAAAASGATLLGALYASRVPFEPFRMTLAPTQIALSALWIVLLTLPFLCAGAATGAVLIHYPRNAGRTYAADLVGGALGASGALVLIAPLGATGTVVTAAALGALAACLSLARVRVRVSGTATVAVAAAVLCVGAESWFPAAMSVEKTAFLPELRPGSPGHILTRWSALSRIDWISGRAGESILVDGGSSVVRIPSETRAPTDLSTAAFAVARGRSVLVLGSGAGWEVRAASEAGARRVMGIEIHPTIVDLVRGVLRERLRSVWNAPGVSLVEDDARSYLSRFDERFDLIVSAHTISNAAAASGSLALAENHSLTVQGLGAAIDRLSQRGLLYITRPQAQLPRLVNTARAALAERGLGAEPRVAVLRTEQARQRLSFEAAMLLTREPLDSADIDAIAAAGRRARVQVLQRPGRTASDEPYARILAGEPLTSGDQELYGRIEPVSDDRPFFQQRRPWWTLSPREVLGTLWKSQAPRRALDEAPVGEAALLMLVVLTLLVAGIALGLAARLGGADLRTAWRTHQRGTVLFAGFGLGFVLAEITLVHVASFVLGSPTRGFAVACTGLLVGAGTGAFVISRSGTAWTTARVLFACALGCALLAAAGGFAHALLRTAAPVRVGGVALVSLVVGLPLGMPLPATLRAHADTTVGLRAAFWAVNGFASVLGGAASLLLATRFGFTAVALTAATIYATLALLGVARVAPSPRPI